jgi:hypothetical protein
MLFVLPMLICSGACVAVACLSVQVEVVEGNARDDRLLALLQQHHKSRKNRIIIFVLYKKEAPRVEGLLKRKGWNAAAIHGDISQGQRTAAVEAFKAGTCPLLIATGAHTEQGSVGIQAMQQGSNMHPGGCNRSARCQGTHMLLCISCCQVVLQLCEFPSSCNLLTACPVVRWQGRGPTHGYRVGHRVATEQGLLLTVSCCFRRCCSWPGHSRCGGGHQLQLPTDH